MNTINYYEDLRNGFLLAHEKTYDFFVIYNEKEQKWVDCGITFMQFRHDYEFREMNSDEVSDRTGGRLPEAEYRRYLERIDKLTK